MGTELSPLRQSDLRRTRLAIVSNGYVEMVTNRRRQDFEQLVEWSSITKTVTGRAFEKLVRSGYLSSDTLVKDLLPFARLGQITLLDLLQHRAGLPLMHPGASTGLIGDPCSGSASKGFFERLPSKMWSTARDRAGKYRYSNVGYALLGKALEIATGEAWFTVVRRLVVPQDSYPSVTLTPPPFKQAVPRLFNVRRRPWAMSAGVYKSAGGLWSTLTDLLRYANDSLRRDTQAGWFVLQDGIHFHTGQARDTGACVILDRNQGRAGIAHSVLRRPNAAKDALIKAMFGNEH